MSALLTTGLAASPAYAQARVGEAAVVQNQVVRVAGSATSQINVGDGVLRDEIVRTGLDSAARLHHPARHLPPGNAGAALVLPQILQFADAAFDLLLSWLRHSRHLRAVAARWSGVAWLRQAASVPCGSPVRIGRPQRAAQHADRDFELARKTPS